MRAALRSAEKVEVQAAIFFDVVPHAPKQDKVAETLGHALVEVRREDPRSGIHSMRRPRIGLGQPEHLLPVG